MVLNVLKSKFHNYIMFKGGKTIAELLLLKSIKKIQKNLKKNHKSILKLLIVNNSPMIFLKKIKQKRKIRREFPYILSKNKRIFLSFKNFLLFIKESVKYNFSKAFHKEIIFCIKDKNNNILKKKKNYTVMLLLKKNILNIDGFNPILYA